MAKRVHIMVDGGSDTVPTPPKQPSEHDIAKDHARYEKRRSTERWIAGSLKTSEHEKIHRRADHILAGKRPRDFKGATGENKGKNPW